MAGRPQHRAMVAELEKRARARFELAPDEPADVLAYAEDWVASGGTIQGLADEMAFFLSFDIRRERLSAYLNSLGEDAGVRLTHARTRGADALAEQSVEISDEHASESVDVSRNRQRASARQWLAGAWDRGKYGQNGAGGAVTISIGALHLGALRAAATRPNPALLHSGETVDAELLPSADDMAALGL